MNTFVAALLLVAAGVLAPAAHAQVLRGRLVDQDTGRPIPMALLILVGERGDSVARAVSDDLGRFTLTAPRPGTYSAVASAMGFEGGGSPALWLAEGAELSVEVRLAPDPLAVAGLDVSLRWAVREPPLVKNGFFERMALGVGYFITPGDIAASSANRLTDILAAVPFLKLVNAYPTDRILIESGGRLCTPAIIVDGLLSSVIRGRRGSPNMISGSEGDIEALVTLKDVDAVEIYRGGQQMPQQFTGMSRSECGAIIIWTKRR